MNKVRCDLAQYDECNNPLCRHWAAHIRAEDCYEEWCEHQMDTKFCLEQEEANAE